jgi:hypothetical protein
MMSFLFFYMKFRSSMRLPAECRSVGSVYIPFLAETVPSGSGEGGG